MATATAPAPTRGPAPAPEPRGGRTSSVVRYALLALLSLVIVGPLLFILVTSFKTRAEATGTPPTWIPQEFTGQALSLIHI